MSILTTRQISGLPSVRVRTYLANPLRRAKDERRWLNPITKNVRILFNIDGPGIQNIVAGILAFTAPGFKWSDNTVASDLAWATQQNAFHELGPYQVPAGPATGIPAPANERLPNNTWTRLAKSLAVRQLLNRAGTYGDDTWKTEAAREDHHAIGIAMLFDNYNDTVKRLPDNFKPSGPTSAWGIACMLTGFSAGEGRAADVLTIADDGPTAMGKIFLPDKYTQGIENVPEKWRWPAIVDAYARAVVDGHVFPNSKADRHSNPVHSILSNWQKLALAGRIAKELNWPTEIWDDALVLGEAHEIAIRAGAAKINKPEITLPKFDWTTGRCL